MVTPKNLNLSPKLFTAQEAEDLIPFLEENFQRFYECRKAVRAGRHKLSVLQLLTSSGGSEENPDHLRFVALQTQVDGYLREIQRIQQKVRRTGVVPKSFHQGLVDFFSLSGDRLVFLCWRKGESTITHWHTLETGFQGRKPLSQLP